MDRRHKSRTEIVWEVRIIQSMQSAGSSSIIEVELKLEIFSFLSKEISFIYKVG